MISWSKFDKFAPYCFIKTSNRIAGCARGIGNALAKHLDKKGFHVFASCRDPKSPGAEDLRKSCSSRLQVFQLDATNDESVQKAVQFVKDNLRTCGLWAIINNAGIQRGFILELSSIQDFKDSLEVNALGPARVTKAFLPLLREFRGRVINMGSVVGQSLSEINDNMLFFQSPILPFL
ncbi:Estradiol 17-beta-dehydrogenase 2 [Araneus ventricosus]|uniref:Estradiol 17-beta-dehydrogenase 2 n=1 Tax=Araneus ventricosus TaxID=182803 RepID=A0A4Y2EAQ1_ARAVE|nr:Estradiol 17-beta-dehydrogenase 2 [Araneus ventricosus]